MKEVPSVSASSRKATRDGFGEGILLLGEKNKDVVVLCSDLTESVKVDKFRDKYPERFFEMGVSEQDMMCQAAGLSLTGKIPFACAFGIFAAYRPCDQVRTTIAYSNLNVKIGAGHTGLTVGQDGATHQCLEDIAIMRSFPNMRVVVPCDAMETKKAVLAAAAIQGPVYLRFGREPTANITGESSPFEIGKINILKEGKDVLIVACGILVAEALAASQILEAEGISAAVANCHTIKPLDEKSLVALARKCGCVVTAEEHQISGGLGSAVCETLSGVEPVPVERVGVRDAFGQSGKAEELLIHYGLKASDIAAASKRAIARKKHD